MCVHAQVFVVSIISAASILSLTPSSPERTILPALLRASRTTFRQAELDVTSVKGDGSKRLSLKSNDPRRLPRASRMTIVQIELDVLDVAQERWIKVVVAQVYRFQDGGGWEGRS